MVHFVLDASALAKRYAPEKGSALVDHLSAAVDHRRLLCLFLGIGEVIGVLLRKRNRGDISAKAFDDAIVNLTAEVIDDPAVRKADATRADMVKSWLLIRKHSINATDAILLRVALDQAAALRVGGDDLVLVASDKRLLDAARAEGLAAFDPETDTQAALDTYIGAAPSANP